MFTKPLFCPNKNCHHHQPIEGWRFIKKGYYRPKWNSKPTPRYLCKTCGKTFSSRAFRPDFKQKKPYQNERFFISTQAA
jgi:hypothetical protein